MSFLDLFFLKKCFSCGRYGEYLCKKCLDNRLILNKNCFICEKKGTDIRAFCNIKNCRKCFENVVLDGIISLFNYHDEIVRCMIFKFKYGFLFNIGYFFGLEMTKVLKHFLNLNLQEIQQEQLLDM